MTGIALFFQPFLSPPPLLSTFGFQRLSSISVRLAEAPSHWQCGAVFGRQAAYKRVVKRPGQWNRFTIQAIGQTLRVVLNGELINVFDMSRFTSATVNPDGSEAPPWLSKAPASLPTQGRIGFQGKHAGAPIWFRNIKIKELG